MSDLYAVMGNPISHSCSPHIHREFARQTGEDVIYEAILVAPDGFPEALAEFRRRGGCGLNVTVPFKEIAAQLAAERTPRAARAGAVNTLWPTGDDRWHGDNTDGAGLLADLDRVWERPVCGARVLLLGAGGAARGALGALLDREPAALTIANRTAEKASQLAAAAADRRVRGVGYEALGSESFDLIVNATSASLGGEVPPIGPGAIAGHACCYDMMYGAAPTPFLLWAQAHGAEVVADGLGMLVEQAAEAFSVWRGVRPRTSPVLEGLRARLGCTPPQTR